MQLLASNLPKIVKCREIDEVIVVDDASTDDSVKFVKSKFPKIVLIEKVTNSGFSTSVNLGVKASRGELVVLLNSDAAPEKEFLQPVLPHFTDPRLFAVGCLDRSLEGDNIVERGRGVGVFTRGFLMHQRGETDKADTLWVSGGSGIYRKQIWEELGGMDAMYDPFYWEDIDISYRAQKQGYKILFEAKSTVSHHHSLGAIYSHYTKSSIRAVAYRNQFLFIWKNITDFFLLWQHFIWLPYHLGKMFVSGDWAFFVGFGKAILRLPEVFRQRRREIGKVKKTDREVLNQFS